MPSSTTLVAYNTASIRVTDSTAKNVIMPPQLKPYKAIFMFDIDDTLLFRAADDREIMEAEQCKNLTLQSESLYSRPTYMIFFEETKKIFQDALGTSAKKLSSSAARFGFITAAGYEKEIVLPYLEKVYDLPKDSLLLSIFVNSTRFGGEKVLKGDKLFYLRIFGLIEKREEIILVDDSAEQLESAKSRGFTCIQATGFLSRKVMTLSNGQVCYAITSEPDYLQMIREYMADFVPASPIYRRCSPTT